MPRGPSAQNFADARSLLLKSVMGSPPRRGGRDPIRAPQYTDEDVGPLADREGLKLLRQVSRRGDASLRSHPRQADCLSIVLLCRRSGVLEKHLPVLPSARALKRIADRGDVRNKREALLVQQVLSHQELLSHLGEWAEVLGRSLDPWLRRKAYPGGKSRAEA